MRLIGALAATAMVCTATAATAQASQAFECALPYRAAMESMAALTATGQSSAKGMLDLLGPSERVEFAAADMRIFGQATSGISLTIWEPAPNDREKIYTVQFNAYFPHDRTVDRALIAANDFRYCGDGSSMCQRENEPEGGPKLRYWRDAYFDDGEDNSPGRLECEYKLREEDVAQ